MKSRNAEKIINNLRELAGKLQAGEAINITTVRKCPECQGDGCFTCADNGCYSQHRVIYGVRNAPPVNFSE